MEKYQGYFKSWEDIQREFGEYKQPLTIEEPEVLLARYDNEGYEGQADVLYRDNGKLYYVSGGHCSCYGLEGQWEPEEYTVEALLGQVDRATESEYGYGFFAEYADQIREALS